MFSSTIAKAAALAGTDGEFRLNAERWNGSLTLAFGDSAWRVAVRAGDIGDVQDVMSLRAGTTEDVVVRGDANVWEQVLSDPAPPGFSDVFAALFAGLVIDPLPEDAQRHLAIRRFCELLRLVTNGVDASPTPLPNRSQHGQRDAATGHYVHLDLDGRDHRLYYEEAGSGIGLICQHTAGADGRQYRHLLEDERVTSRFRVIVYDLPYHGKSLPPSGRAWWAERYLLTREFAMQVPLALASVLGLERPVFMGSSVGGMLALDLARFHPEAFRSVISCEGALFLDVAGATSDNPPAPPTEDPAMHAASMMSWMGATAPEAYRQETRLHYAQGAPGVFPGDINYFAYDHDLRGQAHLIDTERCPVYMLTGEYDFVTVPFSEQAAQEIPGVRYQRMKGMGHFPMSEDPENFASYLLPILEEIP